jgi:hypothetical protein
MSPTLKIKRQEVTISPAIKGLCAFTSAYQKGALPSKSTCKKNALLSQSDLRQKFARFCKQIFTFYMI